MPGKDFTIVHPEKGERVVSADQGELLDQALSKGWKLAGDISISNPEKGSRVVGPGQEDLLRAALAKSWTVGDNEPAQASDQAPPDFVPGDPDGSSADYDMRADVPAGPAPVLPPTEEEANLLAALNSDRKPALKDELVRQQEVAAQEEAARQAQLAADDPAAARHAQAQREVAEALKAERDKQAQQFLADAASGAGPEAAAAQDVSLANVGEMGAAQLQGDQAQIDRVVQARELELQKEAEARDAQLQREYGIVPENISDVPRAASNLVQTVGTGLGRGGMVGLDAPMAYARAGIEYAADRAIRPALEGAGELVGLREPGEGSPAPLEFSDALEAAKQDAAGFREANPATARLSELVGATLPALATGGESVATKGAVQSVVKAAPAGWLNNAASKLATYAVGRPGLTGQLLEQTGLQSALARVGAPALKLAIEGGTQGAVQGAGMAINDAWLRNDAPTAWEYAKAGLEGGESGLAFGTVLGLASGAGISLGARAFGEEAQKKTLKGLGLTGEADVQWEPQPIRQRNQQASSGWKFTPEQTAKFREGNFTSVKDDADKLLAAKRALELDPSVPPEARPRDLNAIHDSALKDARADIDDMIATTRKLEPVVPRPLPAAEYQKTQEVLLKEVHPDLDKFVKQSAELEEKIRPPGPTPAKILSKQEELYAKARDNLNEMRRLQGHLGENLSIAEKSEFVRKNAPTPLGGGELSREQLRSMIDLPDQFLDELAEDSAIKNGKNNELSWVKNLKKRINGQVDTLLKIQAERPLTEGDLFNAVDRSKAEGDAVLGNAAKRKSNYLYDALSPHVEQMRAGLMNEGSATFAGSWPTELAEMQRETNKTWAPSIAAKNDSRIKNMWVDAGEHAEHNPHEMMGEISDSFLNSHIKSLGSVQEEQTAGAMSRLLDTSAEDALNRSRRYGSAKSIADAEEYARLAEETKRVFAEAAGFNRSMRPVDEVLSPAQVAARDSAISGMIGKSGESAKAVQVKADWLKSHLLNRGTAAEEQTQSALERFVDAHAAEAAEYAAASGNSEAARTAKELQALRERIKAKLGKVDEVNALQRLPEPEPTGAAYVASRDSAVQGLLGKSGEAAVSQGLPDRINEKWLLGHLKSLGGESDLQTQEGVRNFLNGLAKDAEDYAYTAGTEEAVKEAVRVAQLRDKVVAIFDNVAKANSAPLTLGEAAARDASLQSMIVDGGKAQPGKPNDVIKRFNADWVKNLLSNAGKPTAVDAEQGFIDYLQAARTEAMAMAKAAGTKEAMARAEEVHNLSRSLMNKLDQVARRNIREAAPRDQAIASTFLGVPAIMGHVKDAITGAMYSSSLKSLARVDAAAQLKSLIQKAPTATGSRVAGGAVKAAHDYGKDVDKFINELFDEPTDPKKQQEQQQQRQYIEQLVGPAVAQAADAQRERTRAFLIEKAGGPPTDPAARAKMQRYVPAVVKPLEAIERMGDGTATQEDREAVQTLAPALHKRFLDQAVENVSKGPLTYDQRLKASRAIGVNVEPTLDPARFAQLQALAGSNPSQQMGGEQDSGAVLSPSRRREPKMAGIVGR